MLAASTSRPAATSAPAELYTYAKDHDPNGIGKFYMGREIAQVMGHEGADWLDRPEREIEEQPARLMDALALQPGDVVVDLGAGTGFFTIPLARAVGPSGRVKAVDIQPEMLRLIRRKCRRLKIDNVDLILGEEADPRLAPAQADLVLMVDVYHEFEFPYEMTTRLVRALKPEGWIVLVEYRAEDPTVPIKAVHKMSEAQIIKEMGLFPLRHIKTVHTLPRQHIIIFAKVIDRDQPGVDIRAAEQFIMRLERESEDEHLHREEVEELVADLVDAIYLSEDGQEKAELAAIEKRARRIWDRWNNGRAD